MTATGRRNEHLRKALDGSGFPLQLAVEHSIRSCNGGWDVVTHEYPWANGDAEGFCDLILQRGAYTYGVVECKRVAGGWWTFVVAKGSEQTTRGRFNMVTTRWGNSAEEGYMRPESWESEFCTPSDVNGKRQPLLEPVAAELLAASKSVGRELETWALNAKRNPDLVLIPMIVTNAELWVAHVEGSAVSLGTGTVAPDTEFQPVGWVRFRKVFSTDQPPPRSLGDHDHAKAKKLGERTVFVIRADRIDEFMRAPGSLEARDGIPFGMAYFNP